MDSHDGLRCICGSGVSCGRKGRRCSVSAWTRVTWPTSASKREKILEDAGFPDAKILATNDFDERIIESLKRQGAKIAVWGVGTKLAAAYEEAALGGVYKLAAVQDQHGRWDYNPKVQQIEAS